MGLVSNPKDGDDVSVRQAIARLGSSKLGPTSTPTFANVTTASLTISGLTTDSLIYPVSGLLTSLGVAANGQIPIGSTGATPVLATITGTANQVNVANAAGSITLSTPQDIHTGASNFIVAGGSFTGVFSGVIPTAGVHLATKEYVDLSVVALKDYWLSDTASGSHNLMYPMETGGAESTEQTAAMPVNDDQLMFTYITEAEEPGMLKARSGLYGLHTHLKVDTGDRDVVVYWTLTKVDADGTSNETLLLTSELSGQLTDSTASYEIHGNLSAGVNLDVTSRLILKIYANVSGTGNNAQVTIYMEGNHDCHFSVQVPSSVWQNQSDILDAIVAAGGVNVYKYIKATGQSEGDLHLSDGSTWAVSKALIKYIHIITSSTNWDLYILQNDNGFTANDATVPMMKIGDNVIGNATMWLDLPYEDEDASGEVHLYYLDNSGANTATIIIKAIELT